MLVRRLPRGRMRGYGSGYKDLGTCLTGSCRKSADGSWEGLGPALRAAIVLEARGITEELHAGIAARTAVNADFYETDVFFGEKRKKSVRTESFRVVSQFFFPSEKMIRAQPYVEFNR